MSTQRYHWLRFWRLEREETFHIGKTCYVKLWFVFAVTCVSERYRVVMPWTRVKTTRPYGPLVLNDAPSHNTALGYVCGQNVEGRDQK